MNNKQKGYYAPDLSGCFIPFLVLCALAIFGLYQVGQVFVWLWDSVSFSF